MDNHLRHLIQELRQEGWEYIPTQTNGSPHFVHPVFGKVAVASTPADWEDECNYTRQRVRKAMRRQQALEPPKPDQTTSPLSSLFQEIDQYEEELRLLTEEAPRFLRQIQELLEPFVRQIVEERKSILHLLGRELCQPRWKRRQREDLQDLCLWIADATDARYGVPLFKEFPFLETLRQDRSARSIEASEENESESEDFNQFDADDWEHWFDQQEDRTTYKPEAPKPKAPVHRHSHSPKNDAKNVGRSLYLQLAKEFHPDKTTDAEERLRRTAWMQQLNNAYAKNDLRALLGFLRQYGNPTQRAEWESAQRQLDSLLQEQSAQLQNQIQASLKNLPPLVEDWISLLTQPKQQERLLRQERRETEQELQHLRNLRQVFSSPQGILRILRELRGEWSRAF